MNIINRLLRVVTFIILLSFSPIIAPISLIIWIITGFTWYLQTLQWCVTNEYQ